MTNATNAVLDRIAALRGIRSDYAISKAFGCDPSRISNYRRGRSSMDDAVAVYAAQLAEIDPAPFLAALQAERAKNPDVKRAWQRLANFARIIPPDGVSAG